MANTATAQGVAQRFLEKVDTGTGRVADASMNGNGHRCADSFSYIDDLPMHQLIITSLDLKKVRLQTSRRVACIQCLNAICFYTHMYIGWPLFSSWYDPNNGFGYLLWLYVNCISGKQFFLQISRPRKNRRKRHFFRASSPNMRNVMRNSRWVFVS